MIFRTTAIAAASAFALTGAAQADGLRPVEAQSIKLGKASGVAYYTVERDGFRVVATLAEEDRAPIRLEAVLAPGQSVILSTPGEASARDAIEVSRQGNGVLVRNTATARN